MNAHQTPEPKQSFLHTAVSYIAGSVILGVFWLFDVLLWAIPILIYLLSLLLAFAHHAPIAIKLITFVPGVGQIFFFFYMWYIRGFLNIFTDALIVYSVVTLLGFLLILPFSKKAKESDSSHGEAAP